MIEHFYTKISGWFTFPNLYKSIVDKYNDAIFVEIGSYQGKSAAYMAVEICNSNKNIKFYCVDTWMGSKEHQQIYNTQEKCDNLYNIFLKNLGPVKDWVIPIKKTSIEASKDFLDNSVDFVFIDASHEYEDVKKDIQAWLPKVKKGSGILAGHDYTTGWPGVRKAVDEFISDSGLTLNKQEVSWWVEII